MNKILAYVLALGFCTTTVEAGLLQKIKNSASKLKTTALNAKKAVSTVKNKIIKKKTDQTATTAQSEQMISATQEQTQNQQTINEEITDVIDTAIIKVKDAVEKERNITLTAEQLKNMETEMFGKMRSHPCTIVDEYNLSLIRALQSSKNPEHRNCADELLKFVKFYYTFFTEFITKIDKIKDSTIRASLSGIIDETKNLSEIVLQKRSKIDEQITAFQKQKTDVVALKTAFEKLKMVTDCFENGSNDAEVRKMFNDWKNTK
ncbi:MAG: hypothetical protein K5766_04415 [Alphaproteobacteria bacterium]|nr:hypothetical protein [Alphaproteobacteria bacterium]